MRIVMPVYSAYFNDDKPKNFEVRMRWGKELGAQGDMSFAEFKGTSTSRRLSLEFPNFFYDGKQVIGTLSLEATEHGPDFRSHTDLVELGSSMDCQPQYWRGTRRKYGDLLGINPEPVGRVVSMACGKPDDRGYREITGSSADELRTIFRGLDKLMAGFSKVLVPPSADWKLDFSEIAPDVLDEAAHHIFNAAICNRLLKIE